MPNGAQIKQLGGLAQALTTFAQSLYKPPSSTIRNIDQSAWPSPLQPVQPIAPKGSQPLGWPFYQGQNLIYTPRPDAEYSAAELKRLATYPLARMCIENVKDQICRIPWRIQLKPLPEETQGDRKKRAKGDKTLADLSRFWEYPDPEHDWSEWLRPLLDDMLVCDAGTVLIRRTGKGQVAELRVVPGDSITRYIDAQGYTPQPPDPAYAQLWQGIPYVDLTTDQLVYKPRNIARRNTVSSMLYGLGPTEQLATEIQIGVERLRFVLAYYKEGSIPDMLQIVPSDIPPDKISEAMEAQAMRVAGDLAKRRQVNLMQGFTKDGKDQIIFPKQALLADPFDDLHIHKICFGYGTSPQRLLKQLNRASAQANQESSEEEGLLPWLDWVQGTVNYIIQKKMKFDGYEISFDSNMERDLLKQAQADETRVKSCLNTPNEIREDRGNDPSPLPEANMLGVITATGFVPLGQTSQGPEPPKGALVPRAGKPEDDGKPPAKGYVNGVAKHVGLTVHTHESLLAEQEQKRFERAIANFLSDQAEKAAARVSSLKLKKLRKADSDEIDTITTAAFEGIVWSDLVAPAESALTSAGIAGLSLGASQIQAKTGSVISISQNLAKEYAHDRAAELVGKKWIEGKLVNNPRAQYAISDTTRDMLRSDIEAAFSKETPMSELADSVRSSGAFSDSRAELISRTEVAAAQSGGTMEAWKASGLVLSRKSVLSFDHEESDLCDQNAAAGPVPLDKPFPSGHMAPPFHPRCNCASILAEVKH